MQQLEATLTPNISKCAAHFGVSPENFASSVPAAGTIAFDIGQAGLTVVGKDAVGWDQYLRPQALFADAYGNTMPTNGSMSDASPKTRIVITDEIDDFCQRRNVGPLVVARVGVMLLSFAALVNAGPTVDLKVHENKPGRQIGKVDSKLSFSISPINTIVVARKKSGLFRK